MGVYQPEGSMMIQQAASSGINVQFYQEDAVFHPKFLEVGGKAAEGIF